MVALPVFDDHRIQLNRWVDALDAGRRAAVQRAIAKALVKLLRVRGSKRHTRLAEYLELAHLALHTGQGPGARYILVSALTSLGWRD